MATMQIPRADWDPDTAWQRYCGFLDLPLESFMEIQAHLLMEQMRLIGGSRIGQRILRQQIPRTVDEFRQGVDLTTYSDYVRALDGGRTEDLPPGEYVWAHTSGAQARFKHVPYTRRAYLRLLDTAMTCLILSAARHDGDVRIQPGDVVRLEPGERHDIINDTEEACEGVFIKSVYAPKDKVSVS